jgi:hypothetical protein
MPSKHQWKLDLGLKGVVFGHKKSPNAVLERIGKLVDEYNDVVGATFDANMKRMMIMQLLFRHCKYAIKNNAKGSVNAASKIGSNLTTTMEMAVAALQNYLQRELTHFLGCTVAELDTELSKTFGQDVTAHGKVEDQHSVANNSMQWYQTDVARRALKLSFRNGKAHRYDFVGPGKGTLNLYDTAGFGDVIEHAASLYAMDKRGRIYASGKEEADLTLKHSSFMAGEATLCAGTIRIDAGNITWVSGRSGHYQPTVSQVVNLLERFSSYQADLSKTVVFREHFAVAGAGPGPFNAAATPRAPQVPAFFEGCMALDLMRARVWPTGVEPNRMRVN